MGIVNLLGSHYDSYYILRGTLIFRFYGNDNRPQYIIRTNVVMMLSLLSYSIIENNNQTLIE